MTNPIADPFVETVDSDADSALARIEATESGAVTVWINRPERDNALDPLTIAALREAFETLHGAEAVRVVFIRGVGGQFCAGGDADWTREAADLPDDENRADTYEMAKLLKAVADTPALTVALVEGGAFGGGGGLVAACDSAVAVAAAQFGFPEVKRGLVPATVAPYVIATVGPRAGRRLLATGAAFGAAHALTIGLVDEVVADAAALETARDRIAAEIMACAPGAVADVKRLVNDIWGRPIDHDLMHQTARFAADARESTEGREGSAAILEGRKPSWTAL